MIKDSSFNPPQDPDERYRNEDYIRKILVERNQKELERMKTIHNLSDEQIELFCEFAELRDNTLKEMRKELDIRKQDNPKATREELDLGVYLEQIEPQVRKAVLTLRHKGYTTYESGFGDFDGQKISFEEEQLKDFVSSEVIKDELARNGANLIIKPKSIEIKFSRFQDLEKIKDIWQKIVLELPPLGKEAKPSNIKAAQLFRERQREFDK